MEETRRALVHSDAIAQLAEPAPVVVRQASDEERERFGIRKGKGKR